MVREVNKTVTETIKKFFDTYPLKTYDKGEKLALAEEPLLAVFYIIEGRVNQYDITPTGNEVIVNVYKPPAFFPMSSAINNTPNLFFFEANNKVIVRVAPAADVLMFLKTNPDVLFDLMSRVYRGIDGVLQRMAHLMGGDAKSRLLFELLNAAYRFGDFRPDGSVFVDLRQRDIANRSGLARESVSRNVQELKAAGLVEFNADGMVLNNLRKLEDLLGNTV